MDKYNINRKICDDEIGTFKELQIYIQNINESNIVSEVIKKYYQIVKMEKDKVIVDSLGIWFTFMIDFERIIKLNKDINENTLKNFINIQIETYVKEHNKKCINLINSIKMEKIFEKIIDYNLILRALIKKNKLYIILHKESNERIKGSFCREYFANQILNIIHIYETDELDYEFILAHELGHYIYESICESYKLNIYEKEKIADTYARSILRGI